MRLPHRGGGRYSPRAGNPVPDALTRWLNTFIAYTENNDLKPNSPLINTLQNFQP